MVCPEVSWPVEDPEDIKTFTEAVARVVPLGQQLDAARELAAQIAVNAPLVLKLLKGFVGQTLPKGPTETAAHARREIEAINASADFHEGIAAFADKRAPVFGGH